MTLETNMNTTTTTGTKHLPACHIGPQRGFQVSNLTVWAASEREVGHDLDWDLRIRIRDRYSSTDDSFVTLENGAENMFPASLAYVDLPPTINIYWPDYEAPAMGKKWWLELTKGLLELAQKEKPTDMVVFCMGGHGRTGTALSILAALTGVVGKGGDPVAYVRSKHCEKAVESTIQINYIKEITGLEFSSVSAFQYGDWSFQYGSTTSTGTASTSGAAYGSNLVYEDLEYDEDDGDMPEVDYVVTHSDGTETEYFTDPRTNTRWKTKYNKAGDIVSSQKISKGPIQLGKGDELTKTIPHEHLKRLSKSGEETASQ